MATPQRYAKQCAQPVETETPSPPVILAFGSNERSKSSTSLPKDFVSNCQLFCDRFNHQLTLFTFRS